jgi:hypothetical protein
MALLGTMYTMTTYGTWLRGDFRGWVEDGRIMPPDPDLESDDAARMKYEVILFDRNDLHRIGTMIGTNLRSRLQQRIYALAVQTWHVHFVVAASSHGPPEVVKCAKEAVRYGLKAGRPIWAAKYDKRYCFDDESLLSRIQYVERHNTEMGLPPRPWDFIESFE